MTWILWKWCSRRGETPIFGFLEVRKINDTTLFLISILKAKVDPPKASKMAPKMVKFYPEIELKQKLSSTLKNVPQPNTKLDQYLVPLELKLEPKGFVV